MLPVGSTLHVMIHDPAGDAVLHPARVVDAEGRSCVAAFDPPPLLALPRPGARTLGFYPRPGGRLVQQALMVAAVRHGPDGPVVGLTAVAKPAPAEPRNALRVCVAAHDIPVRVGLELRCQLADVGADGFAVLAAKALQPGSVVAVTLDSDGFQFADLARVQTAHPLPDGRTRYGLVVDAHQTDVRQTLEVLALAAQRMTLHRMARSA